MNRKTLSLVLGATALVAVLAGAAYYIQGKKPAETAATVGGSAGTPGSGGGGRRGGGMDGRPVPVATAVARSGDIDVLINAIGTVTAKNTVTVKPRVDGLLLRVGFREGQLAKAGEVLAEIDPRPFQMLLDQANGQLARDQAQLTNAVIDQQRYQMLLAKDSISRQQLDTQDALVRQYQGAVQIDRAQVDNAKLQLSFARITAPVAGRAGLRQVDPGNMVRASDAGGLVVITQTQPINAIFAIPAEQMTTVLARLQAGESLVVEAYDREGRNKLASGKLLTIDNQIDSATGTVKLKAEFDNAKENLFPNQFVNLRLRVQTQKDAVLIPAAAIQRGTQGSFVYVANGEEKTVALRPVTLGTATADTVAIEKGLLAGEIVVVDGADKLRQGAKIEMIQAGGSRDNAGSEGKGGGPRPEKTAAAANSATAATASPPPKPAAPAGSVPTPPAATSPTAAVPAPGAKSGERSRGMDRVSPEVAEKLKAMSPDERRAWFQKKREERERQATSD